MRKVLLMAVVTGAIFFTYAAVGENIQQKVMPRKVRVDADFNGKVDRVEYYDEDGKILKVESDTIGDGKMNKWVYYENGEPVKSEKDTNADGKPDVWSDY